MTSKWPFIIISVLLLLFLIRLQNISSEKFEKEKIETVVALDKAPMAHIIPANKENAKNNLSPKLKIKKSQKLDHVQNLKSAQSIEDLEKGDFVFVQVKNGMAVAFGDILIGQLEGDEAKLKIAKTLMTSTSYWEDFPISYQIEKDLKNRPFILEAIKELEEKTSLRFTPGRGDEKEGILFASGKEDCLSPLGKQGGWQPILLTEGCQKREILHEMLHALGFFHEQSRSDRAQYVTINWENILEGKEINFAIVPEKFMDVVHGFSFDYNSIMLYDPKVFSKNGKPTLIPKGPRGDEVIAPSANGLSEMDVERIRSFYGP